MRIKQLRESMGLKQKDIAKKVGITTTTMYRYEKEINEPSIEMLKKFADVFGTSVDYLIEANTPMLDLRKLEDYQKELIDEMLKMSMANCNKLLGYAKSLNEKGKDEN